MELRESSEDYLESILVIQKKRGYVRSVDIANELGVSKASVSFAMRKLRENGYIEMDDSAHIKLTEIGLKTAEKTYEKHVLLTKVLTELGVPRETAEEEACHIEHVISDTTFECIDHYFNKIKNK